MNQFDDLGLAEPILRAVAAEGYIQPTPIQAQVIPAMLSGRDVLGTAQTGTGKTAAFVLPLLDRLARGTARPAPKTCGALILAPTRELATQIADNIATYGRFMKVSVAVILGGVKPGPQVKALKAGVDILVATPGRLLDLVESGAVRLDATSALVLDEADQMLDLGFIPAVRKIVSKLPAERRTALMSATMPGPIRSLGRDFMTDPAEIAIGAVARPIESIAQSVVHTDTASKRAVLTDILSEADVERAIVFTRTKRGADRVNKHLVAAGLSAVAIHGNKSQPQRERALDGFRSGKTTVLVATDIAARGIDVDDVSHVVNFELPEVPEAYVHRIGRTARAGRAGIAISLCDPAERALLRDIERLTGIRLKRDGADEGDWTPLADGSAEGKRRRRNAKGPRTEPATQERAGGQERSKPRQAAPAGGKPGRRDAGAKRGRKPDAVARPEVVIEGPVAASGNVDAVQGTVKWFNGRKGFGFIAPDAGGRDVFVHASALRTAGMGDLNEGDRVVFSVAPDKPGGKPSAVNLQAAV